MAYDFEAFKKDFPVLKQEHNPSNFGDIDLSAKGHPVA